MAALRATAAAAVAAAGDAVASVTSVTESVGDATADTSKPVWIAATVLSIPSLVASCILLFMLCRRWRIVYVNSPVLLELCLSMTVADIVRSVWLILTFLPPTLGSTTRFTVTNTLCHAMGILGQAALTLSVAVYGVVAIVAARLAFGASEVALRRRQAVFTFFAWLTAAVLTAFPALRGQVGPADSARKVCWLVSYNSGYRLLLIVPLGAVLGAGLLVVAYNTVVGQRTLPGHRTLHKLFPFIGISLLAWLPLLIMLLVERGSGMPAAPWLRGVAYGTMAAAGLVSAVKWFKTSPFTRMSRAGAPTHPGTRSLATVTDQSFSESEPLSVYFNRAGRGDEL